MESRALAEGSGSRGAGEVAGEVGGCDPSVTAALAQLPWSWGIQREERVPCVPCQSQGLICVQERINQCLLRDVQLHHAQHCSPP